MRSRGQNMMTIGRTVKLWYIPVEVGDRGREGPVRGRGDGGRCIDRGEVRVTAGLCGRGALGVLPGRGAAETEGGGDGGVRVRLEGKTEAERNGGNGGLGEDHSARLLWVMLKESEWRERPRNGSCKQQDVRKRNGTGDYGREEDPASVSCRLGASGEQTPRRALYLTRSRLSYFGRRR